MRKIFFRVKNQKRKPAALFARALSDHPRTHHVCSSPRRRRFPHRLNRGHSDPRVQSRRARRRGRDRPALWFAHEDGTSGSSARSALSAIARDSDDHTTSLRDRYEGVDRHKASRTSSSHASPPWELTACSSPSPLPTTTTPPRTHRTRS
jgi:hypothetical protein